MAGPGTADSRPPRNRERTVKCIRSSAGVDHSAESPCEPRLQTGDCRLRPVQEVETRVPAANIATTDTRVLHLLRKYEILQVLIHHLGIRYTHFPMRVGNVGVTSSSMASISRG